MLPGAPPRYQEWLDFIFGRFERDAIDPWAMDWEFEASPSELADLFIYTMENCGRDLAKFSDAQVATGLNALLFGTLSNIPHNLMDDSVSEAQKLAILRSFQPLYADLLARRSPPVLGHCNESNGNPLEYITYMLWDVTALTEMRKRSPEQSEALYAVLKNALSLPNEACIESALHGLGHVPSKEAKSIIDDWLDELPQVRPALLGYARAARTGMIL